MTDFDDDGNPIADKDGSGTEGEEGLFNRKTFFTEYRAEFGILSQKQVEGLETLLVCFEQDQNINIINYMAYMFATIKHETADSFHPISEYGGKTYFNRYDPVLADTVTRRATAKRNGNTAQGDGYKYRGRGFVQITWKNNYKKLGDVLGYDLVSDPDKALHPSVAYNIMSYGMRRGIFTGKKLSDYIFEDNADYKNARRIINGLDKADTITRYAEKFESILRTAS